MRKREWGGGREGEEGERERIYACMYSYLPLSFSPFSNHPFPPRYLFRHRLLNCRITLQIFFFSRALSRGIKPFHLFRGYIFYLFFFSFIILLKLSFILFLCLPSFCDEYLLFRNISFIDNNTLHPLEKCKTYLPRFKIVRNSDRPLSAFTCYKKKRPRLDRPLGESTAHKQINILFSFFFLSIVFLSFYSFFRL